MHAAPGGRAVRGDRTQGPGAEGLASDLEARAGRQAAVALVRHEVKGRARLVVEIP